MNRPFLVGRFLPAHATGFGKLPKTPITKGAIPVETLEARFNERSVTYRKRNVQYLIFGQMGMLLALSMTIGAFNLRITLAGDANFVAPDQEIVQMEEIVQTAQIQKPPPPPRPPVPVEVPDDTTLDEVDLDLDAFLDMEIASDIPPPPPAPAFEEDDDDEIFMVVEQMPVIKGGLQQLYKYVEYPKIAQKTGIEGTVVVKLVVSPEGKPTQLEVIKSVHKVLDDAAVAGIMQLEFEPARQRSRAVSVWISIPVVFDLK